MHAVTLESNSDEKRLKSGKVLLFWEICQEIPDKSFEELMGQCKLYQRSA